MSDFSFLANAHPAYIEKMYTSFLNNPDSVEESWRTFFRGFDYAHANNGHTKATTGTATLNPKEFQVLSLIKAYRNRGHLMSTTNPIRKRRDRTPNLELSDFNLDEKDLDTVFIAGQEVGMPKSTLREIVDHMKKVYCGNIGFEYHHIQDREKRRWIRARIEAHHPDRNYDIPLEKKRRLLEKLNGAEVFEKFLHTKYVGQKRFSLEGGEGAIAGLDGIINQAAENGVEEVIIGRAD